MLSAESMKDLARLNDARIDNAIENIESFPSGLDQAVVAQECEVLGKVGLGCLGDLEEIFDGCLPYFEDIENLQSLGIGENLVDECVFLIGLLGKW
jgi:hypothetical protein